MFDLKRLRTDHKISQKEIAGILNCGQSYVSQIENNYNANDIQIDILKKQYGEDLINKYIVTNKSVISNKGVPYYDVDITLGNIDLFNDQTIEPAYFIDTPYFYGCDGAVSARGNSMHPDIKSGTIVGIKEVPISLLLPGEAYLIITNSYRTIKYIRTVKGDDSKLRLVPKNIEEFDEAIIDKIDIQKIFLVKSAIMNRIS